VTIYDLLGQSTFAVGGEVHRQPEHLERLVAVDAHLSE
jgi:hypothetical protein